MAGDNQEPVKGDVRRFVDGGYRPVGATPQQVITQSPDWDGINRGIGMFLDLGNSYARGRSGGSGKQDYSGQYQVEMNDIAANPAYHNANGTYNSKGNEAIRALNQKYAPYVSGAEIRATESYVGGGYKESVDNALRESFIKQQTADYEAMNKRFVEMYDAAHPENINAPYQTRARLGQKLSDQANEFKDLTNTLRNNSIASITDPAKRRMAEIIENRMNTEQLERFRNSGDTVQDQQELTDSIASLAVQLGSTPQEAIVVAADASKGIYAHLNKYRNDIQQLSEDELKFMKAHDADEIYQSLSPQDRAFYALTGQFSPTTMLNGLAGEISVSDAFRTTKVGDKLKRELITSNKNVLNFALNNGDSLTASAGLNKIIPNIQEELDKGNSAPLRGLNRLPAMANIVNEPNTTPETIQILEDCLAKELVMNTRTYYKGDNRITDEMDYQNRATVELAQFLGFSDEKTKGIVNKALETLGMKQVKGVYTPDELVGAMSAFETMPWATEGMDKQSQGKDIGDYLSDENKMTVAPTPEPEIINDEQAQMSRVNVYDTEGYKNFRSQILSMVRRGDIPSDEGQNRLNDYVYNFEYKSEPVVSALKIQNATTNKDAIAEANRINKFETTPVDSELYDTISNVELSEGYRSNKNYVDGNDYVIHTDKPNGKGNPTVGSGVLLNDTNKQLLRLAGYSGGFGVGDKIPQDIVDSVAAKLFNYKAADAIRICNNKGIDINKHPELKKLCIDAHYNGSLPQLLQSFRDYIRNPSKRTANGIMTAVKTKAKKIWSNNERRKWWKEKTEELGSVTV